MKAILLVRVSTQAQDFTEQEREIYQMAINDGYKPEDIIPICEKESGIKLEEEDRAGLNRMKELIESGIGVNCVYCWEVSRIARRKKINFSVLEYLTDHKVQLIIKNPSITLFNNDGTINEGAEVVFTLFSKMAESEMRTKKERFKRSKDARRKQGYYTGGRITYGYMIAEDKKLVPNPEEAEIVKMVFTMYLTGKYSRKSLTDELKSTGFFTDKSNTAAYQFVCDMLTNCAYIGKPTSITSRHKYRTDGNVYPAIIAEDVFEKCQVISKQNMSETKKVHTDIYFGKGIIRCPKCGHILSINKTTIQYRCRKCDDRTGYNINMVDSGLWTYAADKYSAFLKKDIEGLRESYEIQITLLEQKIATANAEISSIKDRMEKVEYKAYVEGGMDIAKADRFLSELNKKVADKQKEIINYESQKTDYSNLLLQYSGEYDGEYIDDVDGITDDKVRYDIITQMIAWATVERVEGTQFFNILTIYDKERNATKLLLNGRTHQIFSKFTPDGVGIEEIEGAYLPRFEMDAYIKAKKAEALRAYKERKRPIPSK